MTDRHATWDDELSQKLDALQENTKLTDWEGEFTDSLLKKRDAGIAVSEKQRAIINGIYREREGAQQ